MSDDDGDRYAALLDADGDGFGPAHAAGGGGGGVDGGTEGGIEGGAAYDMGACDDDDDMTRLGFFARGRDFESTQTTHKFTRRERERMAGFESVPTRAPVTATVRAAGPPASSTPERWLAFGLVGSAVGLVAFVLKQTIELIAKSRSEEIDRLVEDGRSGAALVFALAHASLLAAAAAALVVVVQPAAAGSGVPEVIAYLNGVRVPRVFNVRTAVVKFFSCVCAVSSGMPVGPEGPMIHLGSAIGAGLTQGRSRTLGCDSGLFRNMRGAATRRDLITGGAASGVSAAFGAPVGGLLFAMEEVASFWSQRLTWVIFFSTLCATFFVQLFSSAFEDWRYVGGFGYWQDSASILFEVQRVVRFNVAAVPVVAVIGVVCGLLASLFTFANLKVARWRARRIVPGPARRVAEVAAVALVFTAIMFVLPYSTSCAPESQAGAAVGEEGRPELHRWSCRDGFYNPTSTLSYGSGDDAIKHLLQRGTYGRFSYGPVLAFFGVYFVFACYTAGSAVSSGLVVPMLLIGACVGRVAGMAMRDIVGSSHDWMDPGVFALIGASAFFAGVSRLTVSLCVIMVEISNDTHLLVPIMLAVMISKNVADRLTHSLYHALLEFKCVPLLDADEPVPGLLRYAAEHVASRPVVSVASRARVRDVAAMLARTRHHGFPVVGPGRRFRGLVRRETLQMLLWYADRVSTADADTGARLLGEQETSEYTDEVMRRKHDASGAQAAASPVPDLPDSVLDRHLDVAPYVDASSPTVRFDYALDQTYVLFRALGARHLVVTDDDGRVRGIITRKDLVAQTIEERIARASPGGYVPLGRAGGH